MLRNNSDLSWERYGRSDPYFGVLSQERYRIRGMTPELKAEFFQSGEAHVNHVLDIAGAHFGPQFYRAALDFGCGVGRLVVPLARKYESVTGVDVSKSMLAEARRNCELAEINNAMFVISDDELKAIETKFDFVHSVIVFQHIPRRRGEKLIKRLMSLVQVGGTFAVHVNLARQSTRIRKIVNVARKNFTPIHWMINILQGSPIIEPLMQMNTYDLDRIIVIGYRSGFREFFVEKYHNDEYPGVMLYSRKEY